MRHEDSKTVFLLFLSNFLMACLQSSADSSICKLIILDVHTHTQKQTKLHCATNKPLFTVHAYEFGIINSWIHCTHSPFFILQSCLPWTMCLESVQYVRNKDLFYCLAAEHIIIFSETNALTWLMKWHFASAKYESVIFITDNWAWSVKFTVVFQSTNKCMWNAVPLVWPGGG